ncbi:MAG: tRNA pseudouridine(38-40) synthase TruA [Acidobacteriota bacterium]|nr:tRNA pseudouridine(38-40) synthase TruA [Acidobacteriota bacterium]
MNDLKPAAELQNWKVTLAYDGSDFSGWQVQPGEPTIQAELQAALGRICGETPLPQGSGRTDAGVHALAQVASFALRAPIPAENLHRALNKTLPSAIRVIEARRVASEFHARHSAVAKTYEYRIFRGRICPPTLARFAHACTWKLDGALLDEAAATVVGEHDFTSLAATDADAAQRLKDGLEQKTAVRRIFSSQWSMTESEAGALLIYRVRGNGFLHHMVRNVVGTMLEIGRGQFPAGSMRSILEARSRSVAGPTAPARGLFLHSVEYGGADVEVESSPSGN